MNAHKQRGMTLVELMIALLIGLIVMAVAGEVFLSARQSYSAQTGLGALQENGRFALSFLERDIRMAGFPRIAGPGSLAPAAAFDLANTLDGGSGSDQIALRHTSDASMPGSEEDCLGQQSATINADGTRDVTSRYFVSDGALRCLGSGNSAAQPMVSGVEAMQLQYGEDTDGDTYANVYRRAGEVTDWNRVVAVRVALLVNSQEAVGETADTQAYALLDAAPATPADTAVTPLDERRYARRVFTTTLMLRNRVP